MEMPAIPKVKSSGLASGAKPFIFLKEVRTELSKVTWPSRQQATRLTLVVIAVSIVVAIFIGALDFLFTQLMTIVLKR